MELLLVLRGQLLKCAQQGSPGVRARLSARQCRRPRAQILDHRSLLNRASWSYCAEKTGSRMQSSLR